MEVITKDSSQFFKYVLRVCHIGSLIAISYKTISDYLLQKHVIDQNAHFFMIMGWILVLSGFVNTFVLKPKQMGQKRKLWIGFHHVKLLLTLIFYSPLYKFIQPLNDQLHNLRFYWLIAIIFISPYMRFYREFYVQQNAGNQKNA